jgi:hypothetical protein
MQAVVTDSRAIKSWFGFLFGLFCAGLSLDAWLESGGLAHALSTLGFLCFVYPWSQIDSLFNRPLRKLFAKDDRPMGRLACALTYAALALLLASTLLRFVG